MRFETIAPPPSPPRYAPIVITLDTVNEAEQLRNAVGGMIATPFTQALFDRLTEQVGTRANPKRFAL